MDISQSDIYWRIQSANEDLGYSTQSQLPSNAAANLGLTTNSNGPSRSNTPLDTPFDPMEHALASSAALDPRAFSSNFILPRFASGGPAGNFGFGMAIAEPEMNRETLNSQMYPNNSHLISAYSPACNSPSAFSFTPNSTSILPQQNTNSIYQSIITPASQFPSSAPPPPPPQPQLQPQQPQQQQQNNPTPPPVGSYQYFPSPSNPVYTPYGSSIVAVNPAPTSYKIPLSVALSQPPLGPSSSSSPSAFDPSSLSLPVPPPPGTTTNFAGLYSSSGFDMLSVLARVAARPNQSIQIGPVDTSCAFLVVDARKWDMPIVFASETFTKMTGYTSAEIIGRNCRFLQSPDGSTTQGAPRKYTDGNAAWHMRTHITSGKESQSSLINYMKGGKPFINLVTIIPIAWDTDEIAYYVGFQVDLVDQPNAILDRMKDGTYVVNYSLLNQPTRSVSMRSVEVSSVGGGSIKGDDNGTHSRPISSGGGEWSESIAAGRKMSGVLGEQVNGAGMGMLSAAENDEREARGMLDLLQKGNVAELIQGDDAGEKDTKTLNKLLLDNSDDFIHVLSLKGSLLYCSPSARQILEYEPSELVGKTLSSLCHPSDVIPVLRELKESGSVSHSHVSLLYRIRRKNSGYIWIEASGKLHIEPGKGRKCVILVGRPREVYKMSWNEVRRSGGLGDAEFWNKLSPEGMVLSSTSNVQNVLGFSQAEMVGTSIFQLVKSESIPEIRQALATCTAGTAVTVKYQIKSRRGFVQVVTRFYPRRVDPIDDEIPVDDEDEQMHGPRHVSIIAQTNEISSELRKDKGSFFHQAPAYHSLTGDSPASDSSALSAGVIGNPGFLQSTFKSLAHPSAVSDNVFDELDTTRCTSWQYELHQLENINKKLREEKEHLISLHRKRKDEFAQLSGGHGLGTGERTSQQGIHQTLSGNGTSDGASSSKASSSVRSCANCGRTDSPEWRAGPTGTKSLCNACGLRWAKTQRPSAGGSAATGGGRGASVASSSTSKSKSPSFSPYNESIESSASPVAWR